MEKLLQLGDRLCLRDDLLIKLLLFCKRFVRMESNEAHSVDEVCIEYPVCLEVVSGLLAVAEYSLDFLGGAEIGNNFKVLAKVLKLC